MTSTTLDLEARWGRVAYSNHPDAGTAGLEAARTAVGGATDTKLIVLFCTVGYEPQALLDAVAAVAPNVPLVGCSTAGEIATSGPGDSGVAVFAFGGPGFAVDTIAVRDISEDLRGSGAEAASVVTDDPDRPHQVLLLLTDGLAGDQQEIIRGAYRTAGAAVPLVGGCAGDDLRMQETMQFHGTEVLRNALVAASIRSVRPFGIGVRHGWRKVGQPMLVTAAGENRVLTLDDKPALDVYLERLGAPEGVRDDAEAFTRFALTHPIGLNRRSGEDEIRFIGSADFEARIINTIAGVPEGSLVWVMEGDDASVLDATRAACQEALAPLGDQPPAGVLVFDCIARRGVLGEGAIGDEVALIAQQVEGAPVAGFYTYGEIARTKGVAGFHNQTLVVLAIG